MPLVVNALDHLVINVRDVEVSAAWYQRVLGMARKDFDPGAGKARRVSVSFGDQKINLRPLSADKIEWFTAEHDAAGAQDLCFLTTSTPDEVVHHLKSCGVDVELGPVAKQGARGVLASVYCRDPDGSLIEIASYSKQAE
ncbi:MAG: VOC family protein [Xanthobacteraceae bacterium]|nr:VOC family protein [Xanthobacteraceae bacterium]